MKRLLRFFGLALLILIGFVLAARGGWLNPSEETLRARYALPQSKFLPIGGREVHLVDEGTGPAILLVHGSYGSLRMWNDWAEALKGRYRVVRFDRPGMGLTGPSPDGRYGKEAEVAQIGAVADALKLDRVVLVATSSGGEAAAAWAARNPGRVAGVIFANIAAGPLKPALPHDLAPSFKASLAAMPWLGGWYPRTFWRGVLDMNFADKTKVTPELVREWTDLANRSQGWKRVPPEPGKVFFADTPKDLAAIRAPALLLWSAKDPETTLAEHGMAALKELGSADKQIMVLPDCGHMMPIECGKSSAALALPFIARVSAAVN